MPLILSIPDVDVQPGGSFCVELSASGFTNILGMQFSIAYDPAVLTFNEIVNINLDGLNLNLIGTPPDETPPGQISLSWVEPTLSGMTIPDGTTIFEMCFTAANMDATTTIDFSNTPTLIEVTDGNENFVEFSGDPSTVTIGAGGGSNTSDFTVSVSDESVAPGGQVCADVSVAGFNNILGMQFSLAYDPAQLTFTGIQGINLDGLNANLFGTPPNTDPGEISLSWSDPDLAGLTVPDGTVIFQVCFTAANNDATTTIDFSNTPTPPEIIDGNSQFVPFNSDPGTVTIGAGGNTNSDTFTVSVSDESVAPGGQVCADVSVAGFNNILGMQFSLAYNPAQLTFTGIQGINLAGLSTNLFGTPPDTDPGEISLSWSDPDLAGLTVPDGTVIFQVCFTAANNDATTTIAFSNSPTPPEVIDGNSQFVPFNSDPGTVTIGTGGGMNSDVFTVSVSDETVAPGGQVCADVSVAGFNNILGMQFSLAYNPAQLTFSGIQGINLDGLTTNLFGTPPDTDPGQISLSWVDPDLAGLTVPDGTVIFQVCFTAANSNGTTTINFSNTPTPAEVIDGNSNMVAFNSDPGTVTIGAGGGGGGGGFDGFTIILSDETVAPGGQTCVQVSTANFTNILGMQFSIAYDPGQLQFDDIQNINLDGLNLNLFGTPPDTDPGQISLSWVDPNLTGLTIPDGTVIFEVCFTDIGGEGTTTISFSNTPTLIEVTDGDENPVDFNGDPSTITIGTGGGGGNYDGFTIIVSDETTTPGGQFCADVSVANFENILGMQFSLGYDPAMLQFTGIQNLNLNGLNLNLIGTPPDTDPGQISLSWVDPDLAGLTIPDGTVIFQVCFNVIGGDGTTTINFTNTPTLIEITDGDENPVDFNGDPGEITIGTGGGGGPTYDNFTFVLPDVDVESGDQFCLPLQVHNFEDIVGMQFSINYDPSELMFVSVGNFNLNGLTDAQFGFPGVGGVAPGEVTVVWVEPGLEPVTLADGSVIFNICFEAIGPNGTTTTVTVSGDPTPIEVSDSNDQPVTVDIESATVNISTITAPAPSADITDVACFGEASGAIDLSVAGGTGNYSYQWDYQSATTQDLSNLPAGFYTVTISDNTSGLSSSQTFEVDGPNGPVTINNSLVNNVSCSGENDGSITVFASGGTAPLTYMWDQGLPNGPVQNNVTDGTYNLTVTDANGCTTTGQITVGGPLNPLTIIPTVQNVTCPGNEDGSIQIAITGGSPGFIIDWASLPDQQSFQSGLSPGNYGVTVTDASGCSDSELITVSQTPPLVVNEITSVAIEDGNDGTVSINVSGGVAVSGYDYSWSGPSPGFSASQQTVTNLGTPGEYCVTVTDDNGCTIDACVTLLEKLRFGAFDMTPSCPGENTGELDIEIIGGQAPISYEWFNSSDVLISTAPVLSGVPGGTYTVVVTDATGDDIVGTFDITSFPTFTVSAAIGDVVGDMNLATGSIALSFPGLTPAPMVVWDDNGATGPVRNNLTIGEYCATITPENGCSDYQCFTVGFVPAPLAITALNATEPTCNGGSDGQLLIDFFGGIGPFTVDVGNGSPIVTSETIVNVTNLSPGAMSITVTDSNGETVAANVTINEPEAIYLNSVTLVHDTEDPGCVGRILLDIAGGTPGYQVTWNTIPEGPQLFNLCEGDFIPTVVDANGCEVTFPVLSVNTFALDADVDDADCPEDSNGGIDLNVSGGDPDYTFTWQNEDNEIVSTDEDLSGVPPGSYIVTVAEASGNVLTRQYTVGAVSDLGVEAEVVTNYNGYDVSCFDSADAIIEASGLNSDGNYAYEWTQNDMLIGTSAALDNVPAGVYQVSVIDGLGCVVSRQIEVEAPPAISINGVVKDVTCAGDRDGEIVVNASGGVSTGSSFLYQWGTGAIGPRVSFLSSGAYTVTATDINNCEGEATFSVATPDPIQVTVETEPATEGCNGSARAVVTGGTPPYSYQWNVPAAPSESMLMNLCPDVYNVQVTDSRNCASEPFQVEAEVKDRRFDCIETKAVLTPDGDGLNESFIISCSDEFKNNHLEIYNRWGQLVFEADNYVCSGPDGVSCWKGRSENGTELPEGPYYYVFDYTGVGGEQIQVKGSITLLRD